MKYGYARVSTEELGLGRKEASAVHELSERIFEYQLRAEQGPREHAPKHARVCNT
jgi:hypothetical protein